MKKVLLGTLEVHYKILPTMTDRLRKFINPFTPDGICTCGSLVIGVLGL